MKRHQITKEADGGLLSPADLAVGQTVAVYGRSFFIVDADAFTRSWYPQQMGVELAAAGTYPADPVEAYRQHVGLNCAPSESARGNACPICRGLVQMWADVLRVCLM